jgi:hypothetical protein
VNGKSKKPDKVEVALVLVSPGDRLADDTIASEFELWAGKLGKEGCLDSMTWVLNPVGSVKSDRIAYRINCGILMDILIWSREGCEVGADVTFITSDPVSITQCLVSGSATEVLERILCIRTMVAVKSSCSPLDAKQILDQFQCRFQSAVHHCEILLLWHLALKKWTPVGLENSHFGQVHDLLAKVFVGEVSPLPPPDPFANALRDLGFTGFDPKVDPFAQSENSKSDGPVSGNIDSGFD